jgi:BolA protein
MGTVEKSLREKLLANFSPTRLDIINESHRHSRGTETHFNVIIIAEKFRGLSRVKQHQLVYGALG